MIYMSKVLWFYIFYVICQNKIYTSNEKKLFSFSGGFRWVSLVSSPENSKLRLGCSLVTASPVSRMGIQNGKNWWRGPNSGVPSKVRYYELLSQVIWEPNVHVFGLLFNFSYSASHFLLKFKFLININLKKKTLTRKQ